MPLTQITVTYGTALYAPNNEPATGTVQLAIVAESVTSGYTLVAVPVVLRLASGVLNGSFYTNGQSGLQALVTENVTNATNPAPYVVSIPTSGTLDLSTASRSSPPGSPVSTYLLSTVIASLGDLLVGSGTAAVSRLGVGSDGTVLTADHTQSLGVKWATTSSGFTPYITRVNFTSGDVSFPNTSNTFVPVQQVSGGNPPFEADVTASVGHWCECAVSGLRTTGSAAVMDVGVIVGSSVVRWLSSNTGTAAADGLVSLYSDPSNFTPLSLGAPGFTVTSNDLDGGKVRFVLGVNSNGTQTLKCSSGNPVTLIAKNMGPHN